MVRKGERRQAKGATWGRPWVVALAMVLLLTGVIVPRGSGANLAHAGATAAVSPASTINCTGQGWNTTHLWVWVDGCSAEFWIGYAQNRSFFNFTNPYAQYNFSFVIPWIAEVTPTGKLVRLADSWDISPASTRITVWRDEVNLSLLETINVTGAQGNWTPTNNWPNVWAPPWNVSNTTIGTASLGVTFHLFNATAGSSANVTANSSFAVKFDVGVTGWPWASSQDLLAWSLGSLAADAAHYSFDAPTHTLTEDWNVSNQSFARLVLGGSAQVSYPSRATATAPVSEQVGIYTTNEVDREVIALVTFANVTGNYSSVSYDPWVVFSPGVVPSTPGPTAGLPSWLIPAAAGFGVVAGLGWISTTVFRRERVRREGTVLLEGMHAAIENAPNAPGRLR